MNDPTLNQTLASLGFKTRPAKTHSIGTKHILLNGAIVFTGDAYEVWSWLKSGSILEHA